MTHIANSKRQTSKAFPALCIQSIQVSNELSSTHFPLFPYPKLFHTLLIPTAWIPWVFFNPSSFHCPVPLSAPPLLSSFQIFLALVLNKVCSDISQAPRRRCCKVKLYGVLTLPSSKCTTCPTARERMGLEDDWTAAFFQSDLLCQLLPFSSSCFITIWWRNLKTLLWNMVDPTELPVQWIGWEISNCISSLTYLWFFCCWHILQTQVTSLSQKNHQHLIVYFI